MDCQNNIANRYPNILLSDCLITQIVLKANQISFGFSQDGFSVIDNSEDKYYRTYGAKLVFKGCEPCNVSVIVVKTNKTKNRVVQEISFIYLTKKVNKEKWECVIVEEYYSTMGAVYIIHVKTKKNKTFWCYLKVYYTHLEYEWEGINYDYPFD